MIGRRDALGELRHLGPLDHCAQFGLADQDQLQQLVLVGVDVGQHPQLFKAVDGQVLRLVEDQNDAAAFSIFRNEKILKPGEVIDVAFMRACGHAKGQENPTQKL